MPYSKSAGTLAPAKQPAPPQLRYTKSTPLKKQAMRKSSGRIAYSKSAGAGI